MRIDVPESRSIEHCRLLDLGASRRESRVYDWDPSEGRPLDNRYRRYCDRHKGRRWFVPGIEWEDGDW